MMQLGILLLSFLASKTLAITPPQGKSMRADKNFEHKEVPTGSLLDSVPELPRKVEALREEVPNPALQNEKGAEKKELKKALRLKKVAKKVEAPVFTNLPDYYQNVDRSDVKASDRVVYVASAGSVKLQGLKSGDMIHAVIEQEIKASPSVPTPIRAVAISSQYKGAYFLGEATLDRELKRILLNFSKLRLPGSDQGYTLRAAGLSPKGAVGLEGDYSSQAGMFFVAELASAAAAGLVDSTINRQQNSFGGYVQEPSLSNSAKQGVVSALSKSAERNADAVRQAPEYTEVSGYQEIKILIQDDPIESTK